MTEEIIQVKISDHYYKKDDINTLIDALKPGIKSITLQSTNNKTKTYRITLTDDTYFDFNVVDGSDGATGPQGPKGDTGATGPQGATGKGITKIQKTSTNDLIDTYTITYSDNTTSTFTVTNGADGDDANVDLSDYVTLTTLETEVNTISSDIEEILDELLSETVVVSSKNPIIMTGDSAQLIARIYGEYDGNQTIQFYEKIDGGNDVLLSTVTTNNGVAYYNFTGGGTGERKFYAKWGNFLSETYSILDCIAYNKETSASDFLTYWDSSNNNANTITVDDNGTLIETDALEHSLTYMQIWLKSFSTYVNVPLCYEIEIVENTNYSFSFPIKITDETILWWGSSRGATGKLRVEIDSEKAIYYLNDVEQWRTTSSQIPTQSKCYLQSVRANGNGSIKFKNFKTYPI